jgi:hypothetical protein
MADCEISLSETADVEIQDHADQSAENIPEKRQFVEDMLALKKEELAGLLQEDVSKMNLHQANAHKTNISATKSVLSGYETNIKNRKIGKLVQCYVSRHTCLSQRKDVIDQSSTDRTQHLKFVLKIDFFCLNITIMQRVDGFREDFNDKLFLTEGKTSRQKISQKVAWFLSC